MNPENTQPSTPERPEDTKPRPCEELYAPLLTIKEIVLLALRNAFGGKRE